MSIEKNVPEIRFEGFKGQWSEFSLGELGSVATNKRIFMHQTSSIGEVPFFKIGTFGKEPQLFISLDLFEDYKKRFPFPNKGDLLFSVIGSIGRVVEYTGENQYFQDSNIVWLKHDGTIVNSFLKQFYSIVEWSGLEGSTIKHLYNRNILETKIKMPSPKEQTQIGNYFQKLDSLINQHQQKHDKLSNIKKAMLEKMFPKQGETIPEIRFKGFSGDWEEKELGTDVADIIGGGTPSTSISEFWNGDIDWYSPTEIGDNVYAEGSQKKITALGLKSSSAKILPAGRTVLFTSRAGIGDMAILARSGATNQGFQSFVVKDGFSPYFIYSIGKQIKEFALKHASGSTFLEISGKQLGRMTILIPCEKEQAAIGNYFQKLDTLIDQYQQQITKLNNIKQACLSKMFV
ncbi:restriction endonuclease subunit S [Vibrio diazotrophicus]|uniref:restriction endonuclease subunit S n=1 Tax=Vibrio diazotrophicus TaxID=685 RepID=UPI0005AB3A06|nr:restriction endonuclease subunit S [Vibrio diazotrophicus]